MKVFIKRVLSILIIVTLLVSIVNLSIVSSNAEMTQFNTVFDFSTNPMRYASRNVTTYARVTSDSGYYDSTDTSDSTNRALKLDVDHNLNNSGIENGWAEYGFYPGNPNVNTQPSVPFAGDGIRLWVAFTSPTYTTNNLFKIQVVTGYTGAGAGVVNTTYTSVEYKVSSSGGFIYVPYTKLKDTTSTSILDVVQGTSTAAQRIAAITGIKIRFVSPIGNADLANYINIYVDSLQYYTDLSTKLQPKTNNAVKSENGFVDLTNTIPEKQSNIQTGSGRTIYVSQKRGNDNNTGTQALPYKTINKANEGIAAGDTIIVEEGIYSEQMAYSGSGGTASQPITLKGASGDNVTITSYDPVTTGWELYRDGIYKTNIGSNKNVTHALWMNNGGFNNLIEARWPNADAEDILSMDRAFMGTGTGAAGIYDTNLPAGDWDGATVYAWTGKVYEQYVAFTRTITNYTPGTSLTFDRELSSDGGGSPSTTYTPGKGDWYYLTGALAGLDVSREYYYDNTTGDLYAIMPDNDMPESSEIWVETRTYTIDNWGANYFQFANLNIVGGGVGINANNCTLDNVNVYYADFFPSSDGYVTLRKEYNSNHLNGTNNVWRNSEIAYTMSTGIFVFGNNNTIENCIIHDICYTGGYNSAVSIEPEVKGTIIRRCSLYNSGRFLIQFLYGGETVNTGHQGTIIEYNDVYNADKLTQDGGAIYTYHRDGGGAIIRNRGFTIFL